MRTLQNLLLAIAVAGLFAGCSAEIDQPELCKTLKDQRFESVQLEMVQTLNRSFEYDFGPEIGNLSTSEFDTTIQLTQFTLKATEGIDDWGFIHEASLSVNGQDDAAPTREILSYQKDPNAAPTNELVLQSAQVLDLVDYFTGGKVALTGSITGTPPPSFVTDVKLCLALHARLR